jgi:hypothetical protein
MLTAPASDQVLGSLGQIHGTTLASLRILKALGPVIESNQLTPGACASGP